MRSRDDTDERCPICRRRGTPVAYGLSDGGLTEAARRGEVILGGCVLRGDEGAFRCELGHEWGSPW